MEPFAIGQREADPADEFGEHLDAGRLGRLDLLCGAGRHVDLAGDDGVEPRLGVGHHAQLEVLGPGSDGSQYSGLAW